MLRSLQLVSQRQESVVKKHTKNSEGKKITTAMEIFSSCLEQLRLLFFFFFSSVNFRNLKTCRCRFLPQLFCFKDIPGVSALGLLNSISPGRLRYNRNSVLHVRTVFIVTYTVFPFKTHRLELASHCPLQSPLIIFTKVWSWPVLETVWLLH